MDDGRHQPPHRIPGPPHPSLHEARPGLGPLRPAHRVCQHYQPSPGQESGPSQRDRVEDGPGGRAFPHPPSAHRGKPGHGGRRGRCWSRPGHLDHAAHLTAHGDVDAAHVASVPGHGRGALHPGDDGLVRPGIRALPGNSEPQGEPGGRPQGGGRIRLRRRATEGAGQCRSRGGPDRPVPGGTGGRQPPRPELPGPDESGRRLRDP